MEPDYTNLLGLATANEDLLKNWTRMRPSITQTYDDLISDLRAGNIKQHVHSEDSWEREKSKSFPPTQNVGAFYRGSGGAGDIHYPEGGEGSLPHEILHYFAGHKSGRAGNPKKINPYMKADMALGGWLPSLHPAGRRPTLRGDNFLSNWWNENMATKSAQYSNDPQGTGIPFWKRYGERTRAYHPWFDEHAYDTTAAKMKENYGKTEAPIAYDKNQYPIYRQESSTAQSFRDAFATARKSNAGVFDWGGRKYTTELA